MPMWGVTVPPPQPLCAMPRRGLAKPGADSWGRPTFHCAWRFERQWGFFGFFFALLYLKLLFKENEPHAELGMAGGHTHTSRQCNAAGLKMTEGRHGMLPTEHRKLGCLLTSPQGGPGQHHCNRDVANKTTQGHLAALPTACWALPKSLTCRKPLCNGRHLTPAGSNALEMASHCTPAPQLGEHPWPRTPDPPLCQCPLWETRPIAKGGSVLKLQEFPSSCFPAGLGAQCPANPLSSWQPCRSTVPCSEEPQHGLSPSPWPLICPESQQHPTPAASVTSITIASTCTFGAGGRINPTTGTVPHNQPPRPLNAAGTLPAAGCLEKAQQWVLTGREACPPPPPGPPGPCSPQDHWEHPGAAPHPPCALLG